MPLPPPLDLPRWLRENSDRLRPPVNNFCLYSGADFIVMAIGGPNARADYHVNETEVLRHPKVSFRGVLFGLHCSDRNGSTNTGAT
jgi:hypothetical protein